jgi:hypothetical protein
MQIAVANFVVKPTARLRPRAPGHLQRETHAMPAGRTLPHADVARRPPRPAIADVKTKAGLPGALFPIAVAIRSVQPSKHLRPRAPGHETSETQSRAAGRTYSHADVARRPQRPAIEGVKPSAALPGALFPIAVANLVVNPRGRLRPRAPGHHDGELQSATAGRTHSHAARRKTSAAPGHDRCDAQVKSAGRTYSPVPS